MSSKQAESRIKSIISKKGSFADNNAIIAAEWDFNKNEKAPNDYLSGSNANVWWICSKCNHSYKARINSRVHGAGCPNCRSKRRQETIIKRSGAFIDDYPELLNEWDFERNETSPSMITKGCNKKFWWKCKKNHSWKTTISARIKGHNCPYCAGFYPTDENNLQVKAPQLAKEWHPTKNGELTPSMVSPYSMKKVWWKCERGHEWQATVSNRFQGRNCAQCSAELRTSFPEQAIVFYLSKFFNITSRNKYSGWEIDIYLPDYKIGIEYDGIAYHSKKYHAEREKRKSSDLLAAGIDLIRIKENYEKEEVDNQTIWFIVDHSYKNFPNALKYLFALIQKKTNIKVDVDINIERDRIDILSQYTNFEKNNSFAVRYPDLCVFWNYDKNNGLLPEHFTYMSNKKVWWKCSKCKGEWQETIINVSKGNKCPYCSGHKVLKGYNDLATLKPNFALEWDYEKNIGIFPDEFTIGSSRYVWWKCKNGHSWKAQIANRTNDCPYCTGRHIEKPINMEQWMKKYNVAKEYYNKYGHLNIPTKYVCDDGLRLGMWIHTQRVAKRNCNLTDEQERLLDEIGMLWQLKPGVKKT